MVIKRSLSKLKLTVYKIHSRNVSHVPHGPREIPVFWIGAESVNVFLIRKLFLSFPLKVTLEHVFHNLRTSGEK